LPTWKAISPPLTTNSSDFLSFISQAYSSTGDDTVFTTSDDGKVFRTANWGASTAYALGTTIVGGGHTQKVTTAGTSGSTEPTWNTGGGGTKDGTVVWTDEGTAGALPWTDITGNLPKESQTDFNQLAFLTSVTFNPSNSAEAWVTVGRLARPGENVGRVYHTTNADKGAATTWTNIEPTDASKALPPAPVFSVVKEPNSNTIDVGTYYGAWQCTTCQGSNPTPNWQRLGSTTPPSLPINVMVRELNVSQDNKNLVAWTFGRGIWTIPLS
jgi:hypothetical protein